MVRKNIALENDSQGWENVSEPNLSEQEASDAEDSEIGVLSSESASEEVESETVAGSSSQSPPRKHAKTTAQPNFRWGSDRVPYF